MKVRHDAACQPSAVRAGPSGRFYGWRIVSVAFFVDFIAVGFFFYSFGVFFKALVAEFGGSRFGVGMGLALANVASAAAAPFLGRALDRTPIRRIMLAGTLSVSAGFLLLSRITAMWQFFAVLGTLLALGTAAMGGLSTAKLVTNWFSARRGTALGIATMGISLSGMLMPPLAVVLIARLGWRGGFATYGVLTLLLVAPVVMRFVVNRPEEMGQLPDGEAPTEALPRAQEADARRWHTREILRSPNFWGIAIPFALVLSALSAVLTHLVPHLTDLGMPAERAAAALAACAGTGVIGKLVFGWLVDRNDARIAVWISLAVQFLGLGLLAMADRFETVLLAGSVFGLGMGGVVPLQGAIVGAAFGSRSFGKVMGLLRPVMVPVHAAGVPLAGWLYDRSGSYEPALYVFAAMYLLAGLALFQLRVERVVRSVPRGPLRRR